MPQSSFCIGPMDHRAESRASLLVLGAVACALIGVQIGASTSALCSWRTASNSLSIMRLEPEVAVGTPGLSRDLMDPWVATCRKQRHLDLIGATERCRTQPTALAFNRFRP